MAVTIPGVPEWLYNIQVGVERRPDGTTDGQGGFTGTEYQPVSSADLPARISTPGGADRKIADQLKVVVTHVFYFKPGADIRVDDQLVFGDRKFIVMVGKMIPSEPVYVKVLAKEYQDGGAV